MKKKLFYTIGIILTFLNMMSCQKSSVEAGIVNAENDVVHQKSVGDFVYGADIGWVSMLESLGQKWQNSDGVQQDVLQILKDKGINSVRIRAFVNPNANGYSPEGWMQGFCNTSQVVSTAVRAKNMGLRVMICFQYADGWTSNPFDTPSCWGTSCLTSMDSLKTHLYNYTYGVMHSLVTAGVTPEWANLGNEILNGPGFCWPLGQSWTNLDQLCGTAYDAVKAASPSTMVITHIASAGAASSFAPQFYSNGGKNDAWGFSFYPYWAGGLYPTGMDNFVNGCNYITGTYGKPVFAIEIGGLATNPANTNTLLCAASNYLKSLPNGLGKGTFYWEPESNPSDPTGYNLGATSQVSSKVYKFTTALDAYTNSKNGNYTSNPGFEVDQTGISSPAGWSEWEPSSASYTETTGGAHGGTYHGTHWSSSAYTCSTFQTTYAPNGTYTLKAWIKSSGGQNTAQMYVKNYGGNEIDYSIKNAISGWTQITISNINITWNWIEFGFYSVASANQWIYFDDVTLTKN